MTSKIVIKDATKYTHGNKDERIFKVVKLANYKNVDVLGQLFTTKELKNFLNNLPSRVTYEVLGAE
jgi:hypothetical protein